MGIIQNLRRKRHFDALQSVVEMAASIKAYHLAGDTCITALFFNQKKFIKTKIDTNHELEKI